MNNEYMPEYRPLDTHALAVSCSRAKWGLVVMAIFCFAWAIYTFFTQPYGGNGFLMITPIDGPAGLVRILPVCMVAVGAVASVVTMISHVKWALGWFEPAMGFIMLLVGLVWMFNGAGNFSQAFTLAGILLALYQMVAALELYRQDNRMWVVNLGLAVATWIIAMALGLNMAAPAALLPMAALEFFVAAVGFTVAAAQLAADPQE